MLRVLDVLYRYPETSYRSELIENLYNQISGRPSSIKYDWLVNEWLDEAVRKPFQDAGGLPPGFTENWEYGSLYKTDLDNNGEPDYLITVNAPKSLHWFYAQDGVWRFELLGYDHGAVLVDVLSTQDINGDVRRDLAYVSTTFLRNPYTRLHLLTRQDGSWKRLPVRTVYGKDWTTTPNGGWRFEDSPDGRKELVLLYGGASPTEHYQVHYRWQDDAFIPVHISPLGEHLRAVYNRIEWADKLAKSGHFRDTLPQLTEALFEDARWEHSPGYRPYILYRLGMAYLFLGEDLQARTTWAQLEVEYPDLPISQFASDVSALIGQENSAWQLCHRYWEESPNWLKNESVDPVEYQWDLPFDVSDWCSPWALVTTPTWERDGDLKKQAASLGLEWLPLSDDFDLNGDGWNDPIGTLDGDAWAFLSDQEFYRPLFAEYALPLDAIPAPIQDGGYRDEERTLQVADLDNDGSPEVWVFIEDRSIQVHRWTGSLFDWQSTQFFEDRIGYRGTARLEGDEVRVKIAEFPYSEDRVLDEWVYELVDGKLTRIDPPAIDPDSPSVLSVAVEALYRQRDPRRALQILEDFQPDPGYWMDGHYRPDDSEYQYAAACTLRALAHDYLDETEAARQAWSCVVEQYTDTAWEALARERLDELSDK